MTTEEERKPVNLTPDFNKSLGFDKIKEITGFDVTNADDFKSQWERFQKPNPVIEKKDYEFKDDYIKNAVSYYEQNGDLKPYIQNNVDWASKDPAELIREDLKRNNPEASDYLINHLYKQEMAKYNVAEDAPDEDKQVQKELLEMRAKKIAVNLTEEQKKFSAPENPSVDVEQWATRINESDSTKNLLTDKTLNIGDGDTSFSFEVESPESLVNTAVDSQEFFKLFTNKEGEIDLGLWYKVAAYAQNPDLFEGSLINHGQSLGKEIVVKDLKNNELGRRTNEGSGEPSSLLDAFATKGKTKAYTR